MPARFKIITLISALFFISLKDIHASGVVVSPASVTLSAGQSAWFNATVSENTSGSVIWTLSRPVGTINNGYYVAPAVITMPQTVVLIATSDSSQMGSAVISLMPGGAVSSLPAQGPLTQGPLTQVPLAQGPVSQGPVSQGPVSQGPVSQGPVSQGPVSQGPSSFSLSPSFASLSAGQSVSFTAFLNGTSSNGAVVWSVTPPVGTIWNGVYQAPATVVSPQTVTVTASNLAEPGQNASAIISLNGGQAGPTGQGSVSISPGSASLSAGGGALFTATVTGESSTAVSWSISPPVGTVTNGYYTAPASISVSQTVTLTATSLADPTKSASASISLNSALPADNLQTSNGKVKGVVQLVPSSVSLNPGQSTQFTFTAGGSALAAKWSLVPNIGSVVNGYYTAPSVVSSPTSVTLIATSVANSSRTASAAISLQPNPAPSVAISLSPSSASLSSNQVAQFAATVTGSSNTAVTWSLSPATGSLSNGTYTAPAVVTAQQAVTVTATSAADSTKSASATVTLIPVAVSLSPATISLAAGNSAQFMATVTGASNTSVTWSIAPPVGSVVNGLYQAPATISSSQTVTITAASVADPTKTAQATISLTASAGSSLSVSPALISLGASQTQQFSASSGGLGGGGPVSVQWSISPAVGSITSAGLYTAPGSVSSQQNITVTATGGGGSASATVTLTPPSTPQQQPSTIVLPLEVIGPNGTTVGASFNVPSTANVSGPLTLAMQIHGLRFDAQASVQVNNSAWLPISSSTVTLLGLASAYGGIGGGFHTLQMTMNLPAGVVTTGTNTVTFMFNGTDGRVSGFRVLGFNIQDSNGNQFINPSTFVWDDPNTWTPPSSASSDISAGQTLWSTASLTIPTASGPQPIQAHCMDCHTQDGRDLKYFNYSNNSIETRAIFHGLTAQQGIQIASYIRSLNVSNPGRPWNPPYQPGPGLDSQPVDSWSAGAGISAVLNSDQDMLNAMFPSGVQPSFFSPTGVLDIRETPIALQLPDWNSWLPTIHPMDAFSDFLGSTFFWRYGKIRSELVPGDAAAYANSAGDFGIWFSDYANYAFPKISALDSNGWTIPAAQQMYSLMLWVMVKNWELNHEFQLEGMAQTIFTNPSAEARAWDSSFPFFTAPDRLHILSALGALDNGLPTTWTYLTVIWYHMQLILNNSEYEMQGTGPITWQYVYGFIDDLSYTDSPPQTGLLTLWLTKAIQISNNGIPPNTQVTGWFWENPDISRLTSPAYRGIWPEISPATRTAIYSGMAQAWLTEVQQFTPQQFWAAGYDPTVVPNPGQPDSDGRAGNGSFADRMYYMIPQLGYYGVSQTLINQLAAWAQTIWPNGNWAATTSATCAPAPGDPTYAICSTEQ